MKSLRFTFLLFAALLPVAVSPLSAQDDGGDATTPRRVPLLDSIGRPEHVHAGEDLFNAVMLNPTVPGDEYWDGGFGIPTTDGDVHALASSGDTVFVGGAFLHVGRKEYSRIAFWDGGKWQHMGSGVDGLVYTIAVSGEDVYVGGEFTMAGGVPARNIARWNRTTGSWSTLGEGISGSDFATVSAIATRGDSVYVGGHFRRAGPVDVSSLARWDRRSSTWSAVGLPGEPNGVDGDVLALGVQYHRLYVGGNFSQAGGLRANSVVCWNDSSSRWETLSVSEESNGLIGYVNAIAVVYDPNPRDTIPKDRVVFGGEFIIDGIASLDTTLFPRMYNHIISWGKFRRTAPEMWLVAGRVDGVIRTIAAGPQGGFYTGGSFRSAGPDGTEIGIRPDIGVNYVATTETKEFGFSPLGFGGNNGVDGYVNAITVSGQNVYVGGSFRRGGKNIGGRVVRYNLESSAWSALYAGPNGTIFALGARDTSIWAGGLFTTTNGQTAYHLARWDGEYWDIVNPTIDGPLYAIDIDGDDIYVAGFFDVAARRSAINVARFNIPTREWFSLGVATGVGGGRTSFATAVAVRGSDVYVGGQFTIADEIAASNVAHWDRTTGVWSALGEGVNGIVYAIGIAPNGDVYVGGDFSMAGAIPAANIARWDGTEWHPLGVGTNGRVWEIAFNGDEVFVGGNFTRAGGDSTRFIARWDEAADRWLPIGGGVTGGFEPIINAIEVIQGRVFAAGYFEQMGGVDVSHIAMWDGSAWSPLGSGVDNQIRAMATNGDGLYVAGDFTTAGGKLSHHIGRWMKPSSTIVAGLPEQRSTSALPAPRIYPNPAGGSATVRFMVPSPSRCELRIYDLLGNEVALLLDRDLEAGEHQVEWMIGGMSEGTYCYRFRSGDRVASGTVVVMR